MKINSLLICFIIAMLTFVSCGDDEPDYSNNGGKPGSSTETRESKPVVKIISVH